MIEFNNADVGMNAIMRLVALKRENLADSMTSLEQAQRIRHPPEARTLRVRGTVDENSDILVGTGIAASCMNMTDLLTRSGFVWEVGMGAGNVLGLSRRVRADRRFCANLILATELAYSGAIQP